MFLKLMVFQKPGQRSGGWLGSFLLLLLFFICFVLITVISHSVSVKKTFLYALDKPAIIKMSSLVCFQPSLLCS